MEGFPSSAWLYKFNYEAAHNILALITQVWLRQK